MKEAIINLLKLESIVTILMTLTFCIGCFLVMKSIAPEIPASLVDLFGVIIGYFFGQKSGRALAKIELQKDET